MTLRIRSFTVGQDEKAFIKIFNEAFDDYEDIRRMTIDELKKMQNAPNYNADGTFIAEWNGEPAGMIDAYVDKLRKEPKGIIQWLSVLPNFRRKRIATRLMEKALENLEQRRIKIAETWGQPDREGCTRVFANFGFRQVRVTDIMEKNLQSLPQNAEESGDVRLREMRMDEGQEIALLSWLENEGFKGHANFKVRTVEETKYMLADNPWFKKQKVFFAFMSEQPVGYVLTGIDEELNKEKNVRHGWILEITVLKSHRRRGIGTCLMLQAMRWLKSQRMQNALLYVEESNPTEALKLYEKIGFKTVKRNIIYELALS